MKKRFSLKNKLFAVILIILIFNILLLLALSTTLLDKLYIYDKTNKLKTAVNSIRTPFNEDDYDSSWQNMKNFEAQNMSICLFSIRSTFFGTEPSYIYYSRFRLTDYGPFITGKDDADIRRLIRGLEEADAFTDTKNDGGYYVFIDEKNHFDNNISVLAYLNDNNYIIIQTPIQYIKENTNLAIRYNIYISAITFLVGAAIVYFIADRATRPIREMQAVADKISNLDFSDKCMITSEDEIGLLSDSINNMSDKLQEYIYRLRGDLERQEKTDKMRKQLIANISHDFKTPLTLIMSYSEALMDMKDIVDDNTRDEYLQIIINEGNKMSEFVQELLKLSQLESGMIKIEKSNFSINDIINSTVGKNGILAENRGLNVEKNISGDYIVYADYYRIQQVFQNLYENAVKYASDNGTIKVTTEQTLKGKCKISIYNNGKTISDEDMENIFTSFYRADKSRKNMGSYGLGLAIVKVTMDMHGEAYGVKNVEDGVEFWFELDMAELETENDILQQEE